MKKLLTKTAAVVGSAGLILGLASCSRYNSPEDVIDNVGCITPAQTETNEIAGEVLGCDVEGGSVAVLKYTETIIPFVLMGISFGGGGYAKVNDHLVIVYGDAKTVSRVFDKLSIKPDFSAPGPESTESTEPIPTEAPSDYPTDEPTYHGDPGEGTPNPEDLEPTEDEPTQDEIEPIIGEAATYGDGVKVKVTAKNVYPDNEYDTVSRDGTYLLVTVKVTNNSGQKLSLDMANISVSYGEDGEQASNTYADGTDAGFNGVVANGKSKTAKFGFIVGKEKAKDLQIAFSPTWEHDTLVWTGSANK